MDYPAIIPDYQATPAPSCLPLPAVLAKQTIFWYVHLRSCFDGGDVDGPIMAVAEAGQVLHFRYPPFRPNMYSLPHAHTMRAIAYLPQYGHTTPLRMCPTSNRGTYNKKINKTKWIRGEKLTAFDGKITK
jgi:hypothetical protein